MKKQIEYWINVVQKELGKFGDLDKVREQLYALEKTGQLQCFEIDDTGFFAYLIGGDFKGGKALCEVMFYIRAERRGSVRLVKKYIDIAEKIALENGCDCVKIGANIGHKDSSLIRLLRRWGYEDDTVSKVIGG